MHKCILCKDTGFFAYDDHTPEGWTTYREPCYLCKPETTLDQCEVVRFESHTPGWMEDRETLMATGAFVPYNQRGAK